MRPIVAALAALILSGCAAVPQARVSPVEAEAARYLQRIDQLDDAGPKVNAVIAINPEALREARAASTMSGPLAGKTILVKDNIETADATATTVGSLALKDNRTGRDAPAIARLRAAGVIVLGKTNLSEWANFRASDSSSGWSGVGGQTKNPFALDRSPCGSSAGSGAAVAAGFAWAAIGTETDGSITCPASVNGIVGLKPTVGLVSRTYIAPISVSQDTAGPMATSVHDAALLLTAMAGTDPADPATKDAALHAADYAAGLDTASLTGVRIGVLRHMAGKKPGIVSLFDAALADLRRGGAEIVEIDWDAPAEIGADEYTVLLYENRTGLDAWLQSLPGNPPVRSLAELVAWNKAHAEGELRWFGQDVFEQSLKTVDEAAYRKARADSLRLAGKDGIDMLLAKYNVTMLVAPTGGPAWPIDLVTGDHFLNDVGAGTLPAVAGYPHLTVPMGAVEGLPVGLSFIGPAWSEKRLLDAGAAYERVRSAALPVAALKRWGE